MAKLEGFTEQRYRCYDSHLNYSFSHFCNGF